MADTPAFRLMLEPQREGVDRRVMAILAGSGKVVPVHEAIHDAPESETQRRLSAAGKRIAELGAEICEALTRTHESMRARSVDDLEVASRMVHVPECNRIALRDHAGMPQRPPVDRAALAAAWRAEVRDEVDALMHTVAHVRELAVEGRDLKEIALLAGTTEAKAASYLGERDRLGNEPATRNGSAWHRAGLTTRRLDAMRAERAELRRRLLVEVRDA